MNTSDFNLSIALVIGINDYQGGVPILSTARQDAEAIAQILEQDYRYQTHLVIDQQATAANLIQWLETVLPETLKSSNASRLIFYFAGHGIALNGDDGPEGYLIPQDARLGDVSTYIPMAQIQKALIKLPCRHFLGILDCCFAGAFRWSSTRRFMPIERGIIHKERFDRFIRDPAWQVITSAAYDQTAFDSFKLQDDRGQQGHHSPFAAALIEALRGDADVYPAQPGKPAGDGVITATELYLYLRDRVEVATEARSMRQTPGIYPLNKHDKGEYIFLPPGHPLNLPPAPPLDVSSNPYRGLESFEEEHQHLFFGRTALTQQLTEFVTTHSLTVVLGSSGSGKSSLVQAGLIPALRQNPDWYFLPPFRPGESPFKSLNYALVQIDLPTIDNSGFALAEATSVSLLSPIQRLADWFTAHPKTHLLVVVDQLEELITFCQDQSEKQRFLTILATAIASYPDQLHLIVTIRSDFEPQFRNTALEPVWQTARFVVPAMNREELRQAIEEPASARVMYFDPHQLVDQLIDEVANMPGALPLLSFALSELYLNYLQRQEAAKQQGKAVDRAMTQADYDELGGVTRSLTQRAEREYNTLIQQDPAYESTVRNIMLRMVSAEGGMTRRQVLLTELAYAEPEHGRVQTAIARFETARLITSGTNTDDRPYYEPAHDALVRGWTRLLDWKKQHLSLLILQRELTTDVAQWQASRQTRRDFGLLWIEDPRLPTMLQMACGKTYKDSWRNLCRWRFAYWRGRTQSDDYWLNQWETDFVWRSFDQKFQRFRRAILGVAAVILALTSLTIYAWQRATISQLQAQAARVLNWLSTPNATEGLVLAIDTMIRSQSIDSLEMMAQSSLLSGIQVAQEANRLQGHEDSVNAVTVSPDGQRIISGSRDKTIRQWDAKTGKPIGQTLQGHTEAVYTIALSPDGQRIISGSGDKTIRQWDVKTGKQIGHPMLTGDTVRSVAVSPNAQMIVSGNDSGVIHFWHVQTGQQIGPPLLGHRSQIHAVRFSPNGQWIASGGEDKIVRLWNVQTRKSNGVTLQGHGEPVSAIDFSPNGKQIVTGSGDRTVRLWDAQTGKPIGKPWQGHSNVVGPVAFSKDGKFIVSGSWDKTVRLWDVATGQLLRPPLQGHGAPVSSVAFSPDGKRIVSGSGDKTVRLWDVQETLSDVVRHNASPISSIAFSPDGQFMITGNGDKITVLRASQKAQQHRWDNALQLWDARAKQPIGPPLLGDGSMISAVVFSPDGKSLVSGSLSGQVQIWDVQKRQLRMPPLAGHQGAIYAVAFSQDGTKIVSGGIDRTVRLWNVVTGLAIGSPMQGHHQPVTATAFSPDGQRIVSGSGDQTLRLWNVQTQQPIGQPLQGHGAPVYTVAFSPDGKYIASGGDDRTVRRWETETGKPIGQPLEGNAPLFSVAFSPDGKRIVSGSDAEGGNGMVQLWDAKTGEPIGQPWQGHQAAVYAVAFSPDGQHIVSSGGDNTLRYWHVSPHSWLKLACTRLQYHPLLHSPTAFITDSTFPNVTQRSRADCQQRVWQARTPTIR